MTDQSFDLIVIGGGPGGYVAAIRAAQLGKNVAVVEREHLGGICLNWGCIPTKALLRSAEVGHLIQRAAEFGFKVDGVTPDLDAIVKRSRKVAKQLNQGVGHLLKKHKVTVFDGHGKLAGKGKVAVSKDGKDVASLQSTNILLATGARARTLPNLQPDGEFIWTYKDALVPNTMPKKLLVVGSGAIGIEFASFFITLGADVTVVEVLDRVLPVEDAEISGMAEKAFKKHGMTIHTSTTVETLSKTKAGVDAVLKDAKGKTSTVSVDRVILAVGITANTENLGLEGTGVKLDRGHVVTDKWGATGEKGVYAIGDLTAPPWLAHKAMHEGVACVEKMFGFAGAHALDPAMIPGCTYCTPQIASVGLTEEKAKQAGHKVKVGRFPFIGNGKAIALGEPEGMIKTVFDEKTGELLGAHMIGAEVTELIQGYAVAKTLETTEQELMQTVFPHPTLSEMMHESVLDAYGRTLHF